MVFTNPWGLLALLAIPLIVGLHFFRDRRRIQRVGGLHLWQFARTSMPVGRRFDRFQRNLPLLFQLLAALLLSLLLAGFDIPKEDTRRHYALIVDDSASMQAGGAESAAAKARELVTEWARGGDRFTLIAAGLRPRIIAGPFAEKAELLGALGRWAPEEPGCDIEGALGLASKFLTGDEKILFLTDDEAAARAYAPRLEIAALGKARENAAIQFADRIRAGAGKDRIVVTMGAYSKGAGARTVAFSASVEGKAFLKREVRLEPQKPVSQTFETTEISRPIELALGEDALAIDNSAVLAPVAVKTVRAAVLALGDATDPVTKALRAVPNVALSEAVPQADLVFTAARDYAPSPRNRRLGLFPYLSDLDSSKTQPRLAEGRAVVIDRRHPATAGLELGGVLWPFVSATRAAGARTPLLAIQGTPLLWFEPLSGGRGQYRFNLLWDRTNLFRQAAWPVLVQGIVEECRDAIPGLARANFRVGETVALNVESSGTLAGRYELLRDGAAHAKYETLPEALSGLPAGGYELRQDGRAALARFQVNFFAPGESDLRAMSERKPDLGQLVSASVRHAEPNKALFLGLALLLIVATALSWAFQDRAG